MKKVARIILGLIFTFSGFVKAIDPWGGAIKIEEYLSVFSLEMLDFLSFPLSIALSTLEFALGLALIFGVMMRITSLLTFIFMSFFSVLTLFIAIFNPISDCGCFGDAIKLSPWQTFLKNALILSPLSIYTYKKRSLNKSKLSFYTFIFIAFALNLYSYLTLPIIDFRPFKVGVNIEEAMKTKGDIDVETTLIYKNRNTDKIQEFKLTDTLWRDTLNWQFVDTKIVIEANDLIPSITDFTIFNSEGDYTNWLFDQKNLTVLCLTRLDKRGEKCLAKHLNTPNKIIITPDSSAPLFWHQVPVYKIDATTLKTIIRAKYGYILLDKATIKEKKNCF